MTPDAQTVAVGIQEALVTTATGMIVVIPAVLFYNYFTHWIEQINLKTEEVGNGLVDMLVMSVVHGRNRDEDKITAGGERRHADAQTAQA